MTIARDLVVTALAVLAGSLWGWMLLSDTGSAGLGIAAALYFATGAGFGPFLGDRWWLAAVAGWPGLVLGTIALFDQSPAGLPIFLALSVFPALIGAYLAHRLRAHRA